MALELVAADGSAIPVQMSPLVGVVADGRRTGAGEVLLEVTEREPDPGGGPGTAALEAAALASIGSAVMITEADGTIVWVNHAFTEMSGYSAAEAMGHTPRLLKSGVHHAGHYDQLWATIRDRRIWRGEVVDRRKDGSHYTVLQNITPITGEAGEITHFVAVHENVTELRAIQARLQGIFDHAPDGIVVFDDDGRLLDANPAAAAMTGYDVEQLTNMTLADLLSDSHLDRYADLWSQFRADGQGRGSLPIVRRDGELIDVEHHAVAGIADGVHLLIARDVTEQRAAEAQRRFQAQLLEAVGEAVIATDIDGIVRYANPAAERLYGWSEEQLRGTAITELNVLETSMAEAESIMAQVRAGQTWSGKFEVRRRDGSTFPALVTTAPYYYDDAGELAGIIGVSKDISDIERTQRLLARHAQQQNAVAELGQTAMGTEDPGRVAALAQSIISEFLGPDIDPEQAPVTGDNPTPHNDAARLDADDGVPVVTGASAEELDGHDYELLRTVTHIVDAARQRRATAAQLEHLATHDPLTGLPNRTLFLDRLEQTRASCQRSGARYAVLFLDLDGLKSINDGLGHEIGDEVLRLAAERLRSVLRPADTVARFGGDEFALLCPDIADEHTAQMLAGRIRSALAAGLPTDHGQVPVTASIGIALSDAATDGPTLLRDVDTAMYAAKTAGRNRAQVFDATMQDEATHRFHMATTIQTALDHNGVEVRYQPTINLATGRIVGVEALARLRTPEGELSPPDQFIPVAEETGLIDELGAAVLERACRDALPWIATDPAFMLAVNLSPRQLTHPDTPETIEALLAQTGIDPTNLMLEITESTLLAGPGVTAAMHRLREDGIRFAIDDFGTGYSSLTHLRHMPVDIVKIDRSFVSGLHTDIGDHAVVAATIDLAHTFTLATTAEGVETTDQRAELIRLGCDYAQGYLWSPPVEAHTITDALRTTPAPLR